jgi:hypothetical protein
MLLHHAQCIRETPVGPRHKISFPKLARLVTTGSFEFCHVTDGLRVVSSPHHRNRCGREFRKCDCRPNDWPLNQRTSKRGRPYCVVRRPGSCGATHSSRPLREGKHASYQEGAKPHLCFLQLAAAGQNCDSRETSEWDDTRRLQISSSPFLLQIISFFGTEWWGLIDDEQSHRTRL